MFSDRVNKDLVYNLEVMSSIVEWRLSFWVMLSWFLKVPSVFLQNLVYKRVLKVHFDQTEKLKYCVNETSILEYQGILPWTWVLLDCRMKIQFLSNVNVIVESSVVFFVKPYL